jgi:polysaccharide deacetylase family protein (PEP-CTERM system associated)
MNQPVVNALTIDVEDYFMVSAFTDVVKFEDWHRFESRVKANTYKIIELLDGFGVKATFFVLGWVAEHYPQLVRDIDRSGHEVACHSYNHRLIYDLTPHEFREDLKKAKHLLEDITGSPVTGFRAPSYSIVEKSLWALDILIEQGFLYDSSIFPIHHDRYGVPHAERFFHMIKRNGGSIKEFPPSTYSILGQNIPIAGGGYLRLLPFWLTKKAIKRINEKEKQPVILYTHPWEIDPQQPKINGNMISRARHYTNLSTTYQKLRALLKEYKFKSLSEFM